jgi:hypothetical protein
VNEPAAHERHEEDSEEDANEPTGHSLQAEAPMVLKEPAGHDVHAAALALIMFALYVPARHS